jgi:hypothetical protein
MTRSARWIIATIGVISLFCGLTSFGTEINWYTIIVLGALIVFIAFIVAHAKKSLDGS